MSEAPMPVPPMPGDRPGEDVSGLRPAAAAKTRREHDLLGEADVPESAYWGIHTLRAKENFPISGVLIGAYPELVRSLALVKHAAALANRDLGELQPAQAEAIAPPAPIAGGALHDQFVVDVIQGGAGTSTNMNANEVIANRALELMGSARASTRRCTRTSTSTGRSRPTTRTRPHCACRPSSARALTAQWTIWHHVRGQGRRVPRRTEDRPHPIAGCGADDRRPGIRAPTR